MKLSRFQISLIFAYVILILIAYIDLSGSLLIGKEAYTSGKFPVEYWYAFRNFSFLIFLIIPAMYYLFVRDKSDTIAIFIASIVGFYTGISDAFYFFLQGVAIAPVLPWLTNHPVIGRVADIFTAGVVTNITLVISIILGLIVTFLLTKLLHKLN